MINLEDLGDNLRLYKGDCRRLIASLPDNSVDSVVTDPPYEIGFMNRSFDSTGIAFDVDLWKDILRVLKPGGHVAAFAGSGTTLEACLLEHMQCTASELDPDYIKLIHARLSKPIQNELF